MAIIETAWSSLDRGKVSILAKNFKKFKYTQTNH